jgi:hypothetical protein
VWSREKISWVICGAVALVLLGFLFLGESGDKGQQGGAPGAPPPAGAAQTAAHSTIGDLLNRTFTQNDPKACTRDLTAAYLHQTFGSEKGALDRCRRSNTPQAPKGAKSIEIQSVSTSGASGTAVLRQSSANTLDGSVVTLRLRRQGGRWKLDQLANVQIDRARFDQHLRHDLGARGYLPAETSCAVAKLDRSVGSDQIERDLVIGESSYEYIYSTAVSCLGRSTLLRELGEGMRDALASRGVSTQVTRCVVGRLTHGVPIVRLRHLIAAGSRSAEAWWQLGYQALIGCAGSGSAGAAQSAAA